VFQSCLSVAYFLGFIAQISIQAITVDMIYS
jgi:hypothetical protein